MEVEAQESNSQNDAIVSSSCEIIFALKQEALFFVESHNWNPDTAVSTFQDINAAVLTAAAELGVECRIGGVIELADVASLLHRLSLCRQTSLHGHETSYQLQDFVSHYSNNRWSDLLAHSMEPQSLLTFVFTSVPAAYNPCNSQHKQATIITVYLLR
ncbi:hypothetical protein ACFX19_002708 [Malus domestica]